MSMVSEAAMYDTFVEPGSDHFAQLAREMFAQAKIDDTLATVLRLTRETFPCEGVSILLADGGRITQAAANTRDAARADELQLDFHQGPSLQTLQEQEHITVADLRFDSRYRFWGPQAADLGFRSVMSLSLADDDTTGALSLYSRHAAFFQADDVALGAVFAQHASVSLAVAREREQLLRAVDARAVIGQAQGILMERYDIGSEQAFTVLRRSSSQLAQPMRFVAEEVVRSRNLPKLDVSDSPTEVDGRQPLRMVSAQEEESGPQRS